MDSILPYDLFPIIGSYCDIETCINLSGISKHIRTKFDYHQGLIEAFNIVTVANKPLSFADLIDKYDIYNMTKRCFKYHSHDECICWLIQYDYFDKFDIKIFETLYITDYTNILISACKKNHINCFVNVFEIKLFNRIDNSKFSLTFSITFSHDIK